jgi:uncharacterized membrane protein
MVCAKNAEGKPMDAELSSSDKSSPAVPAEPVPDSSKCPHCGTMIPGRNAFCPGCGWSVAPLPSSDRAVAAVAYLPLLPAAAILFLPTFRSHRFVRFHAWQSVLLWMIFFILTIIALFLSNLAAAMVFLLFGILASLAVVFLWVVLSVKAWQGERFELPLLGELAARLP